MSDTVGRLSLGLGLVSIGRTSGVHGGQPLAGSAAQELIVGAGSEHGGGVSDLTGFLRASVSPWHRLLHQDPPCL
jgi:hypothetical protein